jgi:hypothetical protein
MASVQLPLHRVQSGTLPKVCIICGRATDGHTVRRMTWRPRSASTLIWLVTCLCFPMIVAAILISLLETVRVTAVLPVCDRHRHYWFWRDFWIYAPLWLLAVVAIAVAVLILNWTLPGDAWAPLFVGTGIALITWGTLITIRRLTSFHLGRVTKDNILLCRVSKQFARACQEKRSDVLHTELVRWPIYDPYPRIVTLDELSPPETTKN